MQHQYARERARPYTSPRGKPAGQSAGGRELTRRQAGGTRADPARERGRGCRAPGRDARTRWAFDAAAARAAERPGDWLAGRGGGLAEARAVPRAVPQQGRARASQAVAAASSAGRASLRRRRRVHDVSCVEEAQCGRPAARVVSCGGASSGRTVAQCPFWGCARVRVCAAGIEGWRAFGWWRHAGPSVYGLPRPSCRTDRARAAI